MCDVITIGSATMDVFVESDDANIVSVYTKNKKSEFMSYPYGAKVEIEDFTSQVGGGGVNTAVNFANLGYKTSAIFKIGDDIYSDGVLEAFRNKDIDLSNIIQDPKESTGFSIILVSFQGDRTVLAHRGANNVFVCFNAGSSSIKKGFNYLKKILANANIVVMNKEEASLATQIQERPDTRETKYSEEPLHPDVKEMLKKLKIRDYQVIVITDGKHGAYAYDGNQFYLCPVFDGPVVSTLGAGDAFASTFCAALERNRLDIGRSLMYASVNSAGAVSEFGATQGLLTFDEIEEKLKQTPEYTYKTV